MVDRSVVADVYSKMRDEELIHFAKNEGTQLTPQSIQLLQAELAKRNFETEIIGTGDGNTQFENTGNQVVFATDGGKAMTKATWNYVLDEKEKGTVDADMYDKLQRKGISHEAAIMLIHGLKAKCKELMDGADTNIILSWIFFFTGIILFIFVSNRSLSVTFGMYGLLLLILSAVGGLKSYYNKKKYQTIVDNIEAEEKAAANPQDAEEWFE